MQILRAHDAHFIDAYGQVAEQSYERDELATAVARNFVVPLAITLPLLGVVIWAAVGRAMRSLTHVNQAVASRAADNLTPIDVTGAPSEIGGLVTNLNLLFGRVQGLMQAPAFQPSSARTSVVVSIGRRRRRHPGAGLGCRSCSGSSTCIEARSGSTRRRRPVDYRSRLLSRVLRDERA